MNFDSGCSATEAGWTVEALHVDNKVIMLYIEPILKVLIGTMLDFPVKEAPVFIGDPCQEALVLIGGPCPGPLYKLEALISRPLY